MSYSKWAPRTPAEARRNRVKRKLHCRWRVSLTEAKRIQERLRKRVSLEDRLDAVRLVVGLDCSYERTRDVMHAAAVVMTLPELAIVERRCVTRPVRFPYVPGYLSFREAPALCAALDALRETPDLVLCDGQGIAHPRGLGLASHIGVLYDAPTIGVAKSRLCGTHRAVNVRKGSSCALRLDGKTVGYVVRTREGVKPLYVSPGHAVSVKTARRWALKLVGRYRLTEPTRQAHIFVGSLKSK